MKQINSMKLIPFAVFSLFSGLSMASGFQNYEQNSSGLGNAYAGSAATAENASTIFYNPAGMTHLQDREISVGFSSAKPSTKFDNEGSVTSPNFTANGDDAGNWTHVPNAYASWALTKDWYVGLGVSRPFGQKTEYNSNWAGAAQATSFELKTVNINPSVAYRVSDRVSLGLGLNWQKLETDYSRKQNIDGGSNQIESLKLDDSAWGWNVGALFDLSQTTRVGFAYRSKIKFNTTGDVNGASANADITLPDTFTMSVYQQLNNRWEMLGDISRTGWKSVGRIDASALPQPFSVLDSDFRNTWRVALGANYKLNDAWKIKYGMAYDQSPVRGASQRTALVPDGNTFTFSLGAQWAPTKTSKVDLGASYLYQWDANIDNDQTTQGHVRGSYDLDRWILGAQYSICF